ncbi:M6 family metalloprotease domain-containing protein [uncultured Muribaculum sp.]|uniref:M6 family metalloprotease domain-containing protein n=1 Tax=uncultured Muribaculum sp. TaxID=1918613 RepID=UPI0025E6437F|nr:M6 family metalloprotease domain-containing protein [uncultured Muribaculum sp.]
MKRFSILSAMALSVLEMAAVRATPYPIETVLPDGSTMTVRLHGDEYGSYVTSTDGYLLMRDARGFFNYAVEGIDGKPVAGTLRAVDVERRTAADRLALSGIDRDALVGAEMETLGKERAARITATPRLFPSRAGNFVDPETHRQAMQPTTPSTGNPHLLVILVQFADTKFTTENPYDTFNRMLNEEGFSDQGCTGSVRDYFKASSGGKYVPDIDLYGPVTVSQKSAYYAGNSDDMGTGTAELTVEACSLIDDDVDFSKYDTDGDGIVDNVYIFYAGYGQADTGNQSYIWPHSWKVYYVNEYRELYFDGRLLGNYTCSNELLGNSRYISGIGTFCHEFSHALGLPDLYDTRYTGITATPGAWSIMDHGSYNNNSRTPPLHSAYERWVLGWLDPGEIEASKPSDVQLRPSTTAEGYDDVQLVRTSSSNEFFLLENRRRQGWDSFIPGNGMLIWHIDFNYNRWMQDNVNVCHVNYGNFKHPGIDIVAASGNAGSGTASFPGSENVTSHSVTTWAGSKAGVEIDGIYESEGGNIYFSVNGGNPSLSDAVTINVPAVDANSVALSWSGVDGVEYYILTIYDKEGNPVVNERVYGTSYGLTLLEASDYTCRLTWMKGTECSYCETRFTTGYLPISVHKVDALDAESIGDNGAVASWLPLALAESYTVEIAACEGVAGKTFTEDFTDRKFHNDGWTMTAGFNTQRYGVAAPSIVLKEGQNLTIPAWERPIDEIRMFLSSNSSMSLVDLVVEVAGADGVWTEAFRERPGKYNSKDKESLMVTFGKDKLGKDAYAVRFGVAGTVNWVVVDDISVIYADTYKFLDSGIAPAKVTGTSFEISGLQPGTTYAYRVIASDASGLGSKPSDWIVFTTTGSSGIDGIEADGIDEGQPWYTLTGLRLDGRPTVAGLYIHNRRIVRIP